MYRNKRWKSILSDQLLPGDVVSIGRSHNNNPIPCDLLLIRGPCIVDESMLTGKINEKESYNDHRGLARCRITLFL